MSKKFFLISNLTAPAFTLFISSLILAIFHSCGSAALLSPTDQAQGFLLLLLLLLVAYFGCGCCECRPPPPHHQSQIHPQVVLYFVLLCRVQTITGRLLGYTLLLLLLLVRIPFILPTFSTHMLFPSSSYVFSIFFSLPMLNPCRFPSCFRTNLINHLSSFGRNRLWFLYLDF